MYFTLQDITKVFDEDTLTQARTITVNGSVKLTAVMENFIKARVENSLGRVYKQHIEIMKTAQGVNLESHCTCLTTNRCKHIAAVLLAYADKNNTSSQTKNSTSDEYALPGTVSTWLERLENAARGQSAVTQSVKQEDAGASPYRFIYVLSPDQGGRHVSLGLCKARISSHGEISSVSQVTELYTILSNPPSYMQEIDSDLLRLFLAMKTGVHNALTIEPTGKVGAQLLAMLLEVRQLFWANSIQDIGKALLYQVKSGPSRYAHLAWEEENERWRLKWEFEPGESGQENGIIDTLFPTEPVFYLNNLVCGELSLRQGGAGIPTKELQAIVAHAPVIGAGNTLALSHTLLAKKLQHIVPILESLKETVRNDILPQPRLLLGALSQKDNIYSDLEQSKHWYDFAQLVFSYDSEIVDSSCADIIVRPKDGGVEKIMRHLALEQGFYQTLIDAGFAAPKSEAAVVLAHIAGASVLEKSADWLQFMHENVPGLIKQGWDIAKLPDYRYDVVHIEYWYASIHDKDKKLGNQWFELEIGVSTNKTRTSIFPSLINLIQLVPHNFHQEALDTYAPDESLLIDLHSGVRVALLWSQLKPILAILSELYFMDTPNERVRLSTLDAGRLDDLAESTQLRWSGGDHLREVGKKLAQFGGVQKITAPQGLQATLRDYQLEGLSWMQFLREYHLAGVLADDMGLGKTLQTLAHILMEKNAGRLTHPALVVAPTSLMSNWVDEAKKFTPDLRVLVLQGKERAHNFENIKQYDLVLTTYALLPRDEKKLLEYEFHCLILDESHYIKNPSAKATQIAGMLHARHRLCLSGTPLENHLGELWSQLHFLMPGLLGEEKMFNSYFRYPIEKQGDDIRRALLFRRIKPFMLRRTKDKVAKELPPKTEIVRFIELSDMQGDLYETVRSMMDTKVRTEVSKKGIARSQIIILDALLKLRQVCCDPRLVKLSADKKIAVPSAKLLELMTMVNALLEEGRKILIFSSFTSMLALVEEEFKAQQILYTMLTGDTVDRAGAIKSFQEGEVPVFLISLKAGGVGLNLTAADTVIHYDPWWNPAAENQATDRAWRIGQDKPVFVYKLIVKDSLEEKILALQQKKADLADAMLGNHEVQNTQITQEDLELIFAPLRMM